MKHRHAPVRELTRERPFMGPVHNSVRGPNPAAHGGVTITESCRCGMERRINVNGRYREAGRWCQDLWDNQDRNR